MTSEALHGQEINTAQYEGLLVSVANHEAKALTIAYMASQGEGYVGTSNELDEAMLRVQGPQPGWKQGNGVAFTYCELSFEPIGAVAKSSIISHGGSPTLAYGLTDLGKEQALAMSGLVLDWSLRYPKVSIQTILGATQSKTSNRSPLYRIASLESIVTAKEGGVAFEDIEGDHPEMPGIRTVTETFKNSAISKILDIRTNQVGYNPVLKIVDPNYNGRRPFAQLKIERKAIYEAMHEAKITRGLGQIALGDLVELTAQLQPEVATKDIRAILMQAISPSRVALPGLQVVEESTSQLGSNKSSRLSIKPEYSDAVASLLNELHMFQSGHNHEPYRQRALAIVGNSQLSSKIMRKAFENSSKAKIARAAVPVGQAVFNMIAESEIPLAAQELLVQINDKFGVNITLNAIRNHLKKMESDNTVVSTQITTIEQGRAQKRNHYSVVASEIAAK